MLFVSTCFTTNRKIRVVDRIIYERLASFLQGTDPAVSPSRPYTQYLLGDKYLKKIIGHWLVCRRISEFRNPFQTGRRFCCPVRLPNAGNDVAVIKRI